MIYLSEEQTLADAELIRALCQSYENGEGAQGDE
jgi:hypothetical protein